MSRFLRDDEIFEFKNELYKYADLKDLRNKSKGDYFKSGDVTNTETGDYNDISQIETFFNDAIKIDINSKLVESTTLMPSDIQEVNRKIMTKEYKDFFDGILEKMQNKTANYEEVMKYWETKKLFKNIEYKYSLNNFVKMNSSMEAINAMKVFSFINRGRIAELVTMIDGKKFKDNNVYISREDLMSLLQFESKDALSKFLTSLEKHEIIKRNNRYNRNNIEFIINPFLFNRIEKVHLSTHLYELFPESFEKFLDLDVYYYFKTLKENEHLSFSTSES